VSTISVRREGGYEKMKKKVEDGEGKVMMNQRMDGMRV